MDLYSRKITTFDLKQQICEGFQILRQIIITIQLQLFHRQYDKMIIFSVLKKPKDCSPKFG